METKLIWSLEARFDLLDTIIEQMHAWINGYRALDGGWKWEGNGNN